MKEDLQFKAVPRLLYRFPVPLALHITYSPTFQIKYRVVLSISKVNKKKLSKNMPLSFLQYWLHLAQFFILPFESILVAHQEPDRLLVAHPLNILPPCMKGNKQF